MEVHFACCIQFFDTFVHAFCNISELTIKVATGCHVIRYGMVIWCNVKCVTLAVLPHLEFIELNRVPTQLA